MNVDSGSSRGFNPDLQGLRATAILLVVAYHADRALLSGGYIGVDVFFVISGFLITGLLAREVDSTGTIDLARFWARRARRLLPAAVFVLLATLAAARFRLSPVDLKMFGAAATTTALYIGNIWFAHISTDYLQAGAAEANPLLHYWSLCVEEQFYLIWPLLVVLCAWLARRRGGRAFKPTLAVGLLALTITSLTASVLVTARSQPWSFFGTPTRAWEFAIGGFVAVALTKGRAASTRLSNLTGLVGFVCILASAVTFTDRTAFPGIAALLPVMGAGLMLAVSMREPGSFITRFFRTSPMQVLGDLSYSWYLWHWPVMVFSQEFSGESPVLWRCVGALLSLALGWATHVFIENPVRFSAVLSRSSRLSIATGMALALSAAGVSLGVRWSAVQELDTPLQRRYQAAASDIPVIYTDGCHVPLEAVDFPECSFGGTGNTDIVLFGDSHAAQWFPALETLATTRDWRLHSFTKSACSPWLFEPFSTALKRLYVECTSWRKVVFGRILEMQPELVLVAASSVYELSGPAGTTRVDAWREGVRATLEFFLEAGIDVVVIRDTPRPAVGGPQCLSRAAWLGRDPSECVFFPVGASVRTEERIVLEEAHRAAVPIIDPGATMCSVGPCQVDEDGLIRYADTHHLTATFARTLAPVLGEMIDQVAGPG